jgi:hypothetical protein
MRVLVYPPHELLLGGSQISTIDLTAEIDRAGQNAIVYGSGHGGKSSSKPARSSCQ